MGPPGGRGSGRGGGMMGPPGGGGSGGDNDFSLQRGGRGGRGGGGGGRGRGGGRGGPSRGGRGGRGGGRGFGGQRRRDPREAAHSGNQRERISVESGALVLIDQFMLANPQLIQTLVERIDAAPEEKDQLIRDYGGHVVSVEPGTYKIERDPFAFSIVIHPETYDFSPEDLRERANESLGRVFVDTRCLAMIDRELLDDSDLLIKYQDLWFAGEEKACRDLLRDNGGAVRYGFNRYGDELGIYQIPNEDVICLWPDVNEAELEEQPAAAAAVGE